MKNPDFDAVDDDDAFRSAMSGVQPRPASDRVPPPRKLPPTRPIQAEADERAVMDELLDYGMFEPELMEGGDTLSYRGDGLQDTVWRRLRRGGYRIRAELDLHGLNRSVAREEVSLFLAECQSKGVRCVRIIHGKGNRSPNTGPVIKTLLDGWLRRRNDVIAFCSARPHDGGTGAVYVLLRAAPSSAPANGSRG
ncbi:Smr/MutS family protein [Nevskia ramosa]|uniref:Smr/MutS family protein n=1 Tax=Nevskia ramosa TaxID=64002 RepID=UPI003D0F8E94